MYFYTHLWQWYIHTNFYLHWSLTNIILHSFVTRCICCIQISYLFSSLTDWLWNINCAQNMLERYPALVLLSQPWQFSVWVFRESDKYIAVDVRSLNVVADVPLVVKHTGYILVGLIGRHTNTVTVDVLWIFLHLIKYDATVQLIRGNSFHYQTAIMESNEWMMEKRLKLRLWNFHHPSSFLRGKLHPEILRGSTRAGSSNKVGVRKISYFFSFKRQ